MQVYLQPLTVLAFLLKKLTLIPRSVRAIAASKALRLLGFHPAAASLFAETISSSRRWQRSSCTCPPCASSTIIQQRTCLHIIAHPRENFSYVIFATNVSSARLDIQAHGSACEFSCHGTNAWAEYVYLLTNQTPTPTCYLNTFLE